MTHSCAWRNGKAAMGVERHGTTGGLRSQGQDTRAEARVGTEWDDDAAAPCEEDSAAGRRAVFPKGVLWGLAARKLRGAEGIGAPAAEPECQLNCLSPKLPFRSL